MGFALQLKTNRLKKGYSLQKLANKVGASKAHIWDLETGRAKNPSFEVLKKLSTALNVPIATLVGENTEPSEENETQAESVVMYRDLQKLEPEDRETIKIMIERLHRRTED